MAAQAWAGQDGPPSDDDNRRVLAVLNALIPSEATS
jgi:hypothetical protein